MKTGVLAGYPVEAMRVRLFDGSVHDEDSHAQDFELNGIVRLQAGGKESYA